MGAAGKLVGGEEIFILEGNAERNEFTIKSADQIFKDNTTAFALNKPTAISIWGCLLQERQPNNV